jgi:hypothetical protein
VTASRLQQLAPRAAANGQRQLIGSRHLGGTLHGRAPTYASAHLTRLADRYWLACAAARYSIVRVNLWFVSALVFHNAPPQRKPGHCCQLWSWGGLSRERYGGQRRTRFKQQQEAAKLGKRKSGRCLPCQPEGRSALLRAPTGQTCRVDDLPSSHVTAAVVPAASLSALCSLVPGSWHPLPEKP